jgi:hypothetical protein
VTRTFSTIFPLRAVRPRQPAALLAAADMTFS